MGPDGNPDGSQTISLAVRRYIAAPAARLFDAWTQPAVLQQWWGPPGVRCLGAEIDLKVGGSYKIINRLPDGSEILIFGFFEVILPPLKLTYSWHTDPGPTRPERVTVRFEPQQQGTEVIVVHERIADAEIRERHREGWAGCLDGLDELFRTPSSNRT